MATMRGLTQTVTPIFLTLGIVSHLFAAADNGIERGDEALRSGNFPWYDADNGGRLKVLPPPADEGPTLHRHSKWERRAINRKPLGWKLNFPNWGWKWPGFWGSFGGVFQILQWIAVTLVVVLLIAALAWAFMRVRGVGAASSSHSADDDEEEEARRDAARVENLPVDIESGKANLRELAERCYRAGDFRNAIIYLFSYQLVQLDKHQVIELAKGKTNRQYLKEANKHPLISNFFRPTMLAFEDVFFGNRQLSRQQMDERWGELARFQEGLEQAHS